MRRRGTAAISANPVLIGAATTLVIIVAVFLAYNANNGLPFVPTYSLKADVPSAANLVVGNEVRVGGTRVGVVDEIVPVRHDDGSITARLSFKLDTTVKPLPVDSTILIRTKSALGLKYVELTKGTSAQGYQDGATIPIKQATPEPVEFDDVLNTFDEKTRAGAQGSLRGFGDALAGRGQDLNRGIEALNPLLRDLVPAMRNLADDRTRLPRLFESLGRFTAIVAPVAEEQASLFRNLDTTFRALASVAPELKESISGGPEALRAATEALPPQRPFLQDSTRLFAALRPGAAALSTTADDVGQALTAGTPALRRSPAFNRQLEPVFAAIKDLATDPLATLGVQDLSATVRVGGPAVAQLTPAQVTCNYISLFFRNAASLLSQGDSVGTGQRFIIVAAPQGPNNEGSPASAPANGGGPGNNDNYLHTNPYPNVGGPDETKECEAGNETFAVGKQSIGNIPGNQGINTEKTKRTEGAG